MRVRAVALVAGVAVGLAVAGCSGAGPAARSAGGGASSAPPRLRDGLPTDAQLPSGFKLLSDTPESPAPRPPIASALCSDLVANHFLATHSQPSEVAWVSLEKPPAGSDPHDGWYGEESLSRYGPGRAEAVMTAVRGAAQRCASYQTVLPGDSVPTEATVSVRDAGVPADEGLVLRTSMTSPGDTQPWVAEVAFVREGDVILTVDTVIDQAPGSDAGAVLPAAVAAYRAAAAG